MAQNYHVKTKKENILTTILCKGSKFKHAKCTNINIIVQLVSDILFMNSKKLFEAPKMQGKDAAIIDHKR
jgi:hypothetical protein